MAKKITRKRFSEEFKLSVLRDYYSNSLTNQGLPGHYDKPFYSVIKR